jgi:flagellar biosynthesis protein FlhG
MKASLFAVASGKGGVGKTVLSIALAQSFARAGERVLLIDGDLGLANIDVQLGLHAKGDLF